MAGLLLPALRLVGWTAAGFALAVGWKLGSHLVGVAMGKEDLLWPGCGDAPSSEPGPDDLLRRRFTKISED